jgi:hypothetical protein
VVYLTPKIERIIVQLSASPEGEARVPMPKGMAYKELLLLLLLLVSNRPSRHPADLCSTPNVIRDKTQHHVMLPYGMISDRGVCTPRNGAAAAALCYSRSLPL